MNLNCSVRQIPFNMASMNCHIGKTKNISGIENLPPDPMQSLAKQTFDSPSKATPGSCHVNCV